MRNCKSQASTVAVQTIAWLIGLCLVPTAVASAAPVEEKPAAAWTVPDVLHIPWDAAGNPWARDTVVMEAQRETHSPLAVPDASTLMLLASGSLMIVGPARRWSRRLKRSETR